MCRSSARSTQSTTSTLSRNEVDNAICNVGRKSPLEGGVLTSVATHLRERLRLFPEFEKPRGNHPGDKRRISSGPVVYDYVYACPL